MQQKQDEVKEFVKANDIHEATFYHWRNKYRNKPRAQKGRSGFAALKINPSPATQAVALFAEVKEIRIYQPVSSSYLKELLQMMNAFGYGDHRKYHLYRKETDMRKGFDSPCGIISEELGKRVLDGDVFIFISRPHDHPAEFGLIELIHPQ